MHIDEEGEYEIFQIDESVFIGADHMKNAWSARNDNIELLLDGK